MHINYTALTPGKLLCVMRVYLRLTRRYTGRRDNFLTLHPSGPGADCSRYMFCFFRSTSSRDKEKAKWGKNGDQSRASSSISLECSSSCGGDHPSLSPQPLSGNAEICRGCNTGPDGSSTVGFTAQVFLGHRFRCLDGDIHSSTHAIHFSRHFHA